MNKQEIRYDYDFLSKPLREKSNWNKHKGKYTKDFIVWVDEEYTRLQKEKDKLENQLVDIEWELQRIEEGYWWMV